MLTIALAGDTMLGRLVGDRLAESSDAELFDPAVRAAAAEADLFLLNLECCISTRGERWDDPDKPFFFRAPRAAARVLSDLGVHVVTLANNHALDYGPTALLDTFDHLAAAGIRWVGAGRDRAEARRPLLVDVAGTRVGIVGASDHPYDFGAGPHRPGIALWHQRLDDWLVPAVGDLAGEADVVIATVHWGPNMVAAPGAGIRMAAHRLVEAGATIVAGHSAHVFHGVRWYARGGAAKPVLFDLGDFIDDYAVDPRMRNDLGLLWFVRCEAGAVVSVEALPLFVDVGYTRVAAGSDREWIVTRLAQACAEFGSEVVDGGHRVEVVRTFPDG